MSLDLEHNIDLVKDNLPRLISEQLRLDDYILNDRNIETVLGGETIGVSPRTMTYILCLNAGWRFVLETLNTELNLDWIRELHRLIAFTYESPVTLGRLISEQQFGCETVTNTVIHSQASKIDRTICELYHDDHSFITNAIRVGLYISNVKPFRTNNEMLGNFIINQLLISHGDGVFCIPRRLFQQYVDKREEFYTTKKIIDLVDFIRSFCIVTKFDIKDMSYKEKINRTIVSLGKTYKYEDIEPLLPNAELEDGDLVFVVRNAISTIDKYH